MGRARTKSRIYVCHTFYHVYVSILKEMKLERTGIFDMVFALDEKREQFFPQLAKYRRDYGNLLRNIVRDTA